MQILLTNDDGIYSPAIAVLWENISDLGEAIIVAPNKEQSGVGHTITFTQPLMVRKVFINGKFFGYGVSGSPADCVKLAVRELMKEPPDLVISGINLGANLGVHVLHSGTVAAAIQGAILGIPSIALSLEYSEIPDIENAAFLAKKIIKLVTKYKLPKAILLNINIPAIPRDRIKGIRITKQYTLEFEERFDRHTDPFGKVFYWLAGTGTPISYEQDTDMEAIKEGFISVTPLMFDLTNHNTIEGIKKWDWPDL